MNKKYIVYTKWIGYSEIEVYAESKEEAKSLVELGDYDITLEKSTCGHPDYGREDEEIFKIQEH